MSFGGARADGDVLRRLQIDAHARHLGELRPQSPDHVKRVDVAVVARLERDEHAAVVLGRIADANSKAHRHRVDGGIGHDDVSDLLLQAIHVVERDVLSGLGRPKENAGVLLRKEPFGNDDEKVAGRDHRGDERKQSREAVAEHEIDSPPIAAGQSVKALFAQVIEPAMMLLVAALEKARGHHRGQRQRNDRGDEDRHRDRH